jgi:hypothetical protein
MRNKSAVLSVLLFLSVLIILISCSEQKAKWGGTIEEEDGITVIRNPKEPFIQKKCFSLKRI